MTAMQATGPRVSAATGELRVAGTKLAIRRLMPTGGPADDGADRPTLLFLHEALGSIGQRRDVRMPWSPPPACLHWSALLAR